MDRDHAEPGRGRAAGTRRGHQGEKRGARWQQVIAALKRATFGGVGSDEIFSHAACVGRADCSGEKEEEKEEEEKGER